eukprot:m.97963 g.97963  ORF g.97963 m.97963 type:complete len:103 (+) comp16733_c1_seq9:500-808(+)
MLLPGSPRAETARHSNCHNVTLVSTRWLAKARSVIDPGPVDNSDFVCQHGRYLPHRVHALADLASEVPGVACVVLGFHGNLWHANNPDVLPSPPNVVWVLLE